MTRNMTTITEGTNTSTSTKVPTWFWIVSGIGLLWNLMGIWNYIIQVYGLQMAEMTEAQQAMDLATPAWVTAMFAIAVFGGTLGCVFLLLRKKWATPTLIVSLVAALLQMGYGMTQMDKGIEAYGAGAAIGLPIAVLGVGALLVWVARKATANQWIA